MRIPDVLADRLGVSENTPVELDIVSGALIMRVSSELALEQLLADITGENLHREINTGPSLGTEAW